MPENWLWSGTNTSRAFPFWTRLGASLLLHFLLPVEHRIPAYASAVLLLLAVGDWPYGFYTFLRITVCLTAVYGAVQAFSTDAAGWGAVLAAIGILFNPIIPVYLSQAAWAPIDVVCAGLIGISPHYLPLDTESSNNSPSSP